MNDYDDFEDYGYYEPSELKSHARKDKIKWIITAVAFALVFVLIGGLCFALFRTNKEESLTGDYAFDIDLNAVTELTEKDLKDSVPISLAAFIGSDTSDTDDEEEPFAYIHMISYSKKYGASTTDEYLKLLGFSDNLFTDTTAIHGDGKTVKRGENEIEFDTDATFDLRSYDSTLSGWDRFCNWLYGVDNGSAWEINDFKPIEEVTEKSISSIYSDAEVANNLKLNEKDVAEFRSWAKSEMESGKKVYLFRFAVTDYIQETLSVQKHGNCSGVPSKTSYPISMAQQAVFLGFEILTVTYNNHGKLTVIPVVESPIHVFDDIDVYLQETPDLEWWQILLAVLALVLLVVILWPVLPYIIQAVIWVIMLPFKLIGAIVNAVKKRRRNKEDDT